MLPHRRCVINHPKPDTILEPLHSGPRGLNATVTVRWRIYWLSSEHVGWRRHDDYSLRATVPLDVRDMQAAIR